MDNLEIGQWPLNVSRVSLLKCVLLINMLISGVVIKMFYLGRGWGGGVVQNSFPSTHNPLFFTQGYARETKREGGGRSKQTKKIINQFAAIILVSNQ